MFENVEVLDKSRHADWKIGTPGNFSFAKDLSNVPLSAREVTRAAKFYPIVFPSEGVMPQALLTVRKGESAFLDENGNWNAPYIPAHIRRYPFILAKTGNSDSYALCIDRDAPHFKAEQGTPLFNEKGEPSDVLNRAMDFLKQLQADLANTERLLKQLEEQELLVPRQIELEVRGEKTRLRGFRAVDTEKLNKLEENLLGQWVKQGVMGIVYGHLMSLENVSRMVRT